MGKALVVKSAAKAACKGMRCSGDFMGALDKRVAEMLQDASRRAKANGRATIRPADI